MGLIVGEKYKVLTIIQPWATLIALGEKKIETRSWGTKYRGLILIHAGKKVDRELCLDEPFKSILAKHGYAADNLPLGAIIAKTSIEDAQRVTGGYGDSRNGDTAIFHNGQKVSGNEYWFGGYEVGRWGWLLGEVEQLEPIPAKGQLSLWNFEYKG